MKRKRFLNISHEVLHFSFGDDEDIKTVSRNFKGSGILNPLDGVRQKVGGFCDRNFKGSGILNPLDGVRQKVGGAY